MRLQKHQIFAYLGMMALILFLIFRKQPEPVYQIAPVKEIETRIEGKETEIKTIETRIGNDKKIIDAISLQISDLRSELDKVKHTRDTFQIVQIQDTLIYALSQENKHLRNVMYGQDSIISAQRYIINSKDTIIAVGKHDLAKVKKQRNFSLLINAIQTGIIIFK